MNTHRGVSVRGCVDGRRKGRRGVKKKVLKRTGSLERKRKNVE